MKLNRQLRPTRGLLSAYYISVLFATLLFRLDFFKEIVFNGQKFVRELLNQLFKVGPAGQDWAVWFSLFIVCFVVVFLIKEYIVEPIRMYVEDESGVSSWETIIFMIIVVGSLVYYVNYYFRIPMPLDIADTARRLLGDASISSFDQMKTAEIVWNIAPLVVLYLIIRSKGDSSAGASSPSH